MSTNKQILEDFYKKHKPEMVQRVPTMLAKNVGNEKAVSDVSGERARAFSQRGGQ